MFLFRIYNFCVLNKNLLLYSYSLPIEICLHICYNRITKEEKPMYK